MWDLARDWIHVPCIGRWILYRWTSREVLHELLNILFINYSFCLFQPEVISFTCYQKFYLMYSYNRQKTKKSQNPVPGMLVYSNSSYLLLFISKLCLTLFDHINCSPISSSVHGIFQARILEWFAISFSRESSLLGDRTCVSCLSWSILYWWVTRKMILLGAIKKKGKKWQNYQPCSYFVSHSLLLTVFKSAIYWFSQLPFFMNSSFV